MIDIGGAGELLALLVAFAAGLMVGILGLVAFLRGANTRLRDWEQRR